MSAIYGRIGINNDLSDEKLQLYDYDVIDFDHISIYKDKNVEFYAFEHNIKGWPYDYGIYSDNNVVVCAMGVLNYQEKCSIAEEISNRYFINGMEMLNDLDGDFTFVLYDKMNNETFLSRDLVGKMTMYYMIQENILYFSTLLMPLYELKTNANLNEKWLCAFYGTDYRIQSFSEEDTVFESILLLKQAGYTKINKNETKYIKCWFPEKIKKIKMDKNNDYLSRVDQLLEIAVKRVLNTNGDIGLTLSSGLDSTTVLYYAATILNTSHKKLHTYTSIPISEYHSDFNKNVITNEKPYVELILDRFNNLIHTYLDSKEYNAINIMEKIMDITETPYKFFENASYIYDISKKAKKDGCKVLLTGVHGNFVYSSGHIYARIFELMINLRWIKAYKEVKAFCENFKISGRRFLRYYLYDIKVGLLDLLQFKKAKYSNDYIKESFRKKHNLNIIYRKNIKINHPFLFMKKYHESAYNPIYINQVTEFDTKEFARTGLLRRDPLKDKDLLEFLLSLPTEIFCSKGNVRKLPLDLMETRLPNEILNMKFSRGKQSADWLLKVQSESDRLEEMFSDLNNEISNNEFLNDTYLTKQIGKYIIKYNKENADITRDILLLRTLKIFNCKIQTRRIKNE